MCCPGHTKVKGDDRTDTLAGKAAITGGLHLGRTKMLRSLRHYLREQSQNVIHRSPGGERRGPPFSPPPAPPPPHPSTPPPPPKKKKARRPTIFLETTRKGIVNQTNTKPVSKVMLGKRGGVYNAGFLGAHT